MHSKEKKELLLNFLKKTDKSFSLQEILSSLGHGFSERSIRRWLFQLVEQGFIEKSGQRRATRYKAKGRTTKGLARHTFSSQSLEIIKLTRIPLFQRTPVAYDEKLLKSYQPNKSKYLSKDVIDQLLFFGKRSKEADTAGTYARHIYNRLLIDLSYNSSRLEGNTYSFLETKQLINEGKSVEGKLDEEAVMILNHKDAIRYLVDNAKKTDVSYNSICTLHYLLSDGLVEAKYAGKVRDYGVRIGGSTYIPSENPKFLEFQLNLICKKCISIENPFEQSFFLLVHLSYLQCFVDVNKRNARLCANIPLIKNNFVPLSFNDIEKDDYISAIIAIYEMNELHPLIDLYVYSYLRTCELYDVTIESMGVDQIRVKYRTFRREMLRHIIINKLSDKPMYDYINFEIKKEVKEEEKKDFLEDLHEDLKELSPERIAGLGVSEEELNIWLKIKKSN